MDGVTLTYTNHRGETETRRIRPIRIFFGSTAWHPHPQWLMEVWDLDKQATRDYALSGMCPTWTNLDLPNRGSNR